MDVVSRGLLLVVAQIEIGIVVELLAGAVQLVVCFGDYWVMLEVVRVERPDAARWFSLPGHDQPDLQNWRKIHRFPPTIRIAGRTILLKAMLVNYIANPSRPLI